MLPTVSKRLLSSRTRIQSLARHSPLSVSFSSSSTTRVVTRLNQRTVHNSPVSRAAANAQQQHKQRSTIAALHARSASTAPASSLASELASSSPSILAKLGQDNMTVPFSEFPPCPPIPSASGPVNMLLPPSEDRKHRYFILDNGLQAIVVSDPNSDKAAASMDVGVGHLSDPDDLPGCAHFCEHLMFMGTKTYPSENEYSKFLSANNGGSNAYTAMTATNYYFDVAPNALEGALDRFAGFFIEPLFADDCTEREIKAVNSEHKKNLQNDLWRFFQLEKSLSKEGHPYGKFGTGDLETLWTRPRAAGRDPRKQLIEWWEREYCARRMTLVVAGREDLDELEQMVRKRFEAVPIRTEGFPQTGRNGVRITFEDPPYGPDQQGVVTIVKPVRDVRALEVTIPVPDMHHFHELKPFHYFAHFLGHEGKGSLLSYLKSEGWVNSLRAGPSHEAAGFGFFKITAELTLEGLEHWKEVSLGIFKYMNLLRNTPPSDTTFNELRKLSDLTFKFAERGRTRDYVTHLATWMHHPVPRENIVSSQYLLGQYDEKWLTAALSLLNPSQSAVSITTQTFPKNIEGSFDQKEAIYGTQYHQCKLDDAFMKEAMSGAAIPTLHLPGPNPFVPEKLEVNKVEVKEPAIRPELLLDSEISRLWYKKDDRFWLPKSNVYVELQSPLLDVTPRSSTMARLLCDLFNDATTEDVYDAELADLSFNLWYAGDTISIGVQGYTDKLALLTETMLKKLMEFKVDPERFEKIVYQVRMIWKNFDLAEPYHVAHYWSHYATTQIIWSQKEKLAELEHITPADVEAYARELFARLYIETLVHGNVSMEEAKSIQEMMERVLKPRALAPGEKVARRQLLLPESSEHIWEIPVFNPSEPNSAVIYAVQTGERTDPVHRARLALLTQLASEPTFNQLRTKEQLGYIVQAQGTNTGLRIIVQSERDPVYVESRIESFFDLLKTKIEEMPEEEFERHRQSLIEKREEQPKNLSQESRRFWSRIIDKYYEFNKRLNEIEYLKKTTKDEVLQLFMETVHPSSSSRRKFSTHLKSQVKPVMFDPESASAIVAAFTKHGVTVDQEALKELLASSPDLPSVQKFATDAVEATTTLASDAATELKELIDGLKGIDAPEANGDKPATAGSLLRPGNVYIDDIHRFKAGLIPNQAAVPVEPLVVSKL